VSGTRHSRSGRTTARSRSGALGDLAVAEEAFARFAHLESSSDVQDQAIYLAERASLHRATGRLEEALADAEATIVLSSTLGMSQQAVKQAYVAAIDLSLARGDTGRADELLAQIEAAPAGSRSKYLDAQAARYRARMTANADALREAAERFRALALPFWHAVGLLEHGELTGDGSSLDAAREIFEELKASPWLERVEAVGAGRPAVPA
jgi:tetratricopeptide (TPR) repeat protein